MLFKKKYYQKYYQKVLSKVLSKSIIKKYYQKVLSKIFKMIINIEYNNKYVLSFLGFILGYLNFPFSNIIITFFITFYETSIKELYNIDLYQFLLFYVFGIAFQNIFIAHILCGFIIGILMSGFINNNKKVKIADYFKNNPTLTLNINNLFQKFYQKDFFQKGIIINFQNILNSFLDTFECLLKRTTTTVS
jgi:hypothetical protein